MKYYMLGHKKYYAFVALCACVMIKSRQEPVSTPVAAVAETPETPETRASIGVIDNFLNSIKDIKDSSTLLQIIEPIVDTDNIISVIAKNFGKLSPQQREKARTVLLKQISTFYWSLMASFYTENTEGKVIKTKKSYKNGVVADVEFTNLKGSNKTMIVKIVINTLRNKIVDIRIAQFSLTKILNTAWSKVFKESKKDIDTSLAKLENLDKTNNKEPQKTE